MCFEAKKTLEKKSGFFKKFFLFFVSIAEITQDYTCYSYLIIRERILLLIY